MIRLIASDLDGTLLQNGAQKLTDRAVRLIHELTLRGVHFVAASGRQYDNERRLFDAIKDEISYIGENGSLCVHNGQVISRGTIEDSLALRIMQEVKKENHFEIAVSREDACFIENNNPDFVNHIVHVMRNTTQIVDDITKLDGPILKIAICNMIDGPHIVDKYLKYLKDMFRSEINVVTSGNIWIDFVAPDANKGSALKKLIDLLGIAPEECVAFGDQYNDVEMLQLVGTSYAMSNAAPGISYYADYVTDSVEDVLEDILADLP
ncbi:MULTISPECIES: HAD family hydrolase [Mediterraneibacter]|uniref:HAD family hydrolase n=1 Tax=Mediterraneibacter TaxID=2316020 RepID=UPI000E4D4A06|nr:HAD family hydrolase [Mediterraneibacter massiliensis]RGT73385.1 HAD family hydrolase [Ruminococcus sp. AF18-22]